MNKREWWESLTDEQRAELRDRPQVAKAMYENRDWPGFTEMVYAMRDMVSDVGRVRVGND